MKRRKPLANPSVLAKTWTCDPRTFLSWVTEISAGKNVWMRRRRLLCVCFWCALGLATGSLAAAESKSQQSREEVVFCAYNVRNWLSMDRYEDGRMLQAAPKPETEKAAVIATLTAIKPDILGLCEMGTEADVLDLQSMLKTAGLHLPHVEVTHGGDPNRRLALLSRFPIAARNSQTSLTYQLEGRVMPFQRGILDVTIHPLPGQPIRFLGVHLKSMREVLDGDQALMRRNEAELLRNHIDRIFQADPSTRLLAYGDFNEHRHEAAIKAIQGSRTSVDFLEDLRVTDANGLAWTHYWAVADSYSRLDYFFVSRSLKAWLDMKASRIHTDQDFEKASDHRPIVAVLRVPRLTSADVGP